MLQNIICLISMEKSSGETGKIIVYERDGAFQTHWTQLSDQEEETRVAYSGEQMIKAWKAAEEIRFAKSKEGFEFANPWLTASLSALPANFILYRKLECFSDRHLDSELFQELKKWRRSAAGKANIPPYYIATDKLLNIISTFVPHKPEELLQIPGIGQAKLDQYGTAILELTRKYPQAHSFPLTWVAQQVSDQELATWLLDQQVEKQERRQQREKQEQEEKLRLLEAISDETPIEELSERLGVSSTNLMRKFRQLAKEGYEILDYLEKQVEQINNKDLIVDIASSLGSHRLKPIFEKLYGSGETLPDKEKGRKYNSIRIVCTYLDLKTVA